MKVNNPRKTSELYTSSHSSAPESITHPIREDGAMHQLIACLLFDQRAEILAVENGAGP